MAIYLPDFIEYQAGRPRLNKSVSISRYGERAISMIQNCDEWWTVNIETQPMYNEDLAEFGGRLAQAQNGMETIVYTVLGKHSLPRAYWNNPIAHTDREWFTDIDHEWENATDRRRDCGIGDDEGRSDFAHVSRLSLSPSGNGQRYGGSENHATY